MPVVLPIALQPQSDVVFAAVVDVTKVLDDEPNPLALVAPKQRTAAQKKAHQRHDVSDAAVGRKFMAVWRLIKWLWFDGTSKALSASW